MKHPVKLRTESLGRPEKEDRGSSQIYQNSIQMDGGVATANSSHAPMGLQNQPNSNTQRNGTHQSPASTNFHRTILIVLNLRQVPTARQRIICSNTHQPRIRPPTSLITINNNRLLPSLITRRLQPRHRQHRQRIQHGAIIQRIIITIRTLLQPSEKRLILNRRIPHIRQRTSRLKRIPPIGEIIREELT